MYVRCAVSGPLPISRGPHGGVILAVWTALTKDRRPAQSVEPDTGQEWQPTTHRSHGDSAAFDEVKYISNFQLNLTTAIDRCAQHSRSTRRNFGVSGHVSESEGL